MPSLIIDVRPGERLVLVDVNDQDSAPTAVELVQKSGRLVRLRVTAPSQVRIEKRPLFPTQPVPSMAT